MIARWWPFSTDLRTASTRIRCTQVIQGLQQLGVDADLYDVSGPPPQVLVLSKRFDPETMAEARRLRHAAGTRVTLDLCDNLFHADSDSPAARQRRQWLLDALDQVDQVIASTPTLAEAIRQAAPQVKCLNVVGDALEEPSVPRGKWGRDRLLAESRLLALRARLAVTARGRPTRFLWFGHHGSSHAAGGLLDLLAVMRPLNETADRHRISLTVISNHRGKFDQVAHEARFECHYLEWDAATFSRAAREHHVALLPVQLNPFTACKTNNRVATSLLHGLAVIADPVPSYLEFAETICIADWPASLDRMCSDPGLRHHLASRGAVLVRSRWNLQSVCRQWLDALRQGG